MSGMNSIVVHNLSRHYGAVQALNKVSFKVKTGDVIGFLGPNGAGKSTTMRILSGIMPASSGSAWMGGTSVAQFPAVVKNKIGYMPENNPLPNEMRVAEYLRFRARLKRVPNKKVRTTVEAAMETCDLARTARRKIIGTLSKGFRQRVGIADALLGDPEIILMDEPTIGLDPHQIQGIRALIDQLRGRLTVLLSSHILPEIERCCDQIIIINQGSIVAQGTSEELRREFIPGNRYQIVYQGSTAALNAILEQQSYPIITLSEHCSAPDEKTRVIDLADNTRQHLQILIKAIAASDTIAMTSFAPKDSSLEDIFLVATKRSWDQKNEKEMQLVRL